MESKSNGREYQGEPAAGPTHRRGVEPPLRAAPTFFWRPLGFSGEVADLGGLQLLGQAALRLLVEGQHHVIEQHQGLVVYSPFSQMLRAGAFCIHDPTGLGSPVLGFQAALQPSA